MSRLGVSPPSSAPSLGRGLCGGVPWRTALQPPGTSLSSGFRSWPRHLSTSTPQGQGLSKHHAVTLWVRPPRLRALARSRGAAGHREVPTQPSRSGQPQARARAGLVGSLL